MDSGATMTQHTPGRLFSAYDDSGFFTKLTRMQILPEIAKADGVKQ